MREAQAGSTPLPKTLDNESWARISPLLDELLELEDPFARRLRLRELAAGDAALEAELSSLVEAYEEPPAILADPFAPDPGSAEAAAPDPDARLGTLVGGYRLTERLGQGGMATVYRGVKEDATFEHQVAVKLVRPGMDSQALLGRFRDEQRILSSLNHPNIARFFGGGVAEDGQPYILMELVDGRPLDRFCDDRRLSVEARLELFCRVCDAVEHAHGRLVVHRDLKPSNVLVTEDGTVKVLDFGVAKLLGQAEADLTALTVLYGVPLTPEFAAPEQLQAEEATTTTDVYALGVVLYDLLAGSRPFPLASLLPLERARKVLETDPERPSTRAVNPREPASPVPLKRDAASTAPSPEEIAERRSTTPQRLRKRLEGDLDTIVLKALRRESERRYPSAAALREDVERHLRDLPIRARPETWTYAFGRFLRRNRTAAALSALLFLSLILGLGLALAGQRAAQREAATSARVVDFLVDAFRTADPTFGDGADVTAIDIVDRAAEKIRSDLDAEPAVRARLLNVLGQSSRALGDFARAEELVEESLRLSRRHAGPEAPETLATRSLLATVYRDSGRGPEAEALFQEVLETEQSLRPGSPLHGTTANDYGMLLADRGDLDAAEALYRTALEIHRRQGPEGEGEVIRTLNNLALVYSRQGDLEEAGTMLREVLDRLRRQRSSPSVDVATALNNLAGIVRRQGDLAEAERLFREALELRRTVLGEDHPDVAQSRNNLGTILYYKDDHEGAAREFEGALAAWKEIYAGDHPRLAAGISNVANIHRVQGRLEEAIEGFEEATRMQERLLRPGHPEIGKALRRWGVTLVEAGRPQEAIPVLERALDIHREAFGPEDEGTRELAEELARAREALAGS